MRHSTIVTITLFGMIAIVSAHGQEGPMPAAIASKLVEIGRTVAPEPTGALYAPLQEKEPYEAVEVERDLQYGPASLHRLDVFTSRERSSARPILIFVRGGAFVAGDKRRAGSPFYDNVMLWAVKSAFVGVNINYRLAPQSPWPAGAEDLGLAVQWVRDNLRARGGDPTRIYLMGHSAGAAHVATYVAHPEFHKTAQDDLRGAVIVSGIFDLTASEPTKEYYGADPARYAERSSLQGLLTTKLPIMIAAAELDPPSFVKQFELLKNARCAVETGCIRALLLPQHSHMSEVYAVNTSDTRLTDQILEFIRAGK